MREYRCSGKCFLKHGKSCVCLVGKLECDSFVGESGEQYNNVEIVENKATVVKPRKDCTSFTFRGSGQS